MCGFAGFIDFSKKGLRDVASLMSNTIIHRGPDDSGDAFIETSFAEVGLGFRRLSIIDLSAAGHQPMYSPDGRIALIFNGEIYNYREIKLRLQNEGHKFISDSDTEVILQAYLKWGKDCVKEFIGMFAIAIYDKLEEKVILIRDRAGVKPLFYYQTGTTVLFASELKAFHQHPDFKKELNYDAVAQYLQYGYIAAPFSIFKNTHKVKPGNRIVIDLKTRSLEEEEYWSIIDHYNKPVKVPYEEALFNTEALLKSACEYRMIADVPVGVFLSGGFDSSAVTAILQKDRTQKIRTFTIGYENAEYNEAVYAKKVAEILGTDHTEYYCTFKDAMDIIPTLPDFFDEPFSDASAIPTILLSRITRKSVTVALSADGGDEIFAGYTKYIKGLKYLEYQKKLPEVVKKAASMALAFARSGDPVMHNRADKLYNFLKSKDQLKAFDFITVGMTEKELSQYLIKPFNLLPTPFDDDKLYGSDVELLNKFLATDFRFYMVDDVLQKVDRATMSVSLEGREPLLDHRLAEYVATLPSDFKLRGNDGKFLLKQIVYKYLPKEVMDRPKMGFNVPVKQWCQQELSYLIKEHFDEHKVKTQGLFNSKTITLLKNEFLKGNPKVDFERVWKLLMFQIWYDRWMK